VTTLPTPVDPPGLFHSPGFAQGMIAPAGATLHVGGQNGADATGALLKGVEAQVEQALRNVLAVLAAAGTTPDNVVKLTIYLAPGVDPARGFAAAALVWGERRTAVTVLQVAPARPGALVEIDAVAYVPAS
jgi:2-iminobutanoate/2-iminopropanoate deaminase